MAGKTYKLNFKLDNGLTKSVQFVVPDGSGKSAYEYAKEAGYTGTAEEFAQKLASNSGYSYPCVMDYGAKGDGATDDTVAFQTALAGDRVVFVPGGTYKLSGELIIGDNCGLELSQDTVLEFTQTSGNCIVLGMSSTLKGNHATVKVPYAFDGHVLHAYSTDHTSADINAVPPWGKWDPQWKSGRYVSDLNICKADSRGFHYAVNPGDCKGTAVYISADNTDGYLTFMWGVHYSGLRIAGAFAYGIHAQNFDEGWLHEMRIDAFIDACETGVCLEDCSQTYISATIQPRRAYTEANQYAPYAKNGIKLVRSKNTDLSGSRVWDWNDTNTLWAQDNEYQHISMVGDCSGTILNDYMYHGYGDTRKRIYTDNGHNLETLTILQEPIDRWFKVIEGEPYYTDGLTNQKLLREDALDEFVCVDSVKNFTDALATATDVDGTIFNDIGYIVGKRFTSLGTGTDLTDSSYYMTTGFIEVPLGSTIYGKGLHFDDTEKTYAGIVYYNANRERVASMSIGNVVKGIQDYVVNYTRTGDGFSVQIPSTTTLSNLGVTYIRMVFPMTCVGDAPMLSINDEIKYTMEGFLADGIKVKGENVIGGAVGPQGPQGPQGPAGESGKDGYTPQKGVDYFTAADKGQIVSEVLAGLPTGTVSNAVTLTTAQTVTGVKTFTASNFFDGEQKLTFGQYCPTVTDIASGIGASMKNARAVDCQLFVSEVYAPYWGADITHGGKEPTSGLTANIGQIDFYVVTGAASGQPTGRKLIMQMKEDGLYVLGKKVKTE